MIEYIRFGCNLIGETDAVNCSGCKLYAAKPIIAEALELLPPAGVENLRKESQ